MINAWETAVRYQLAHTVALLAVAMFAGACDPTTGRWLHRAGWWWTLGIVLFPGSLYALALGGPRWLGPVTPLGGLAFIIGWAMLLPAATKPKA